MKPRAPLQCPACGAALIAKQSPLGNPFFAHLRRSPDCWLTGETLAHRLLKVALASAVRDSGWYADLEVAGEGARPWRADVLARRPDDGRRIAFEAQLAPIDADEIGRRSDNYAASGVEVCWVSDKMRPWLGRAPYLVVRPVDSDYTAEAGLWRFEPDYCKDRRRCDWNLYGTSAIYPALCRDSGPPPCPGHGKWTVVHKPLVEVVRLILEEQVQTINVDARLTVGSVLDVGVAERHRVWTAPHYIRLFQEQLAAEAEYARVAAAAEEQARLHHGHVEALLARQSALRWPACSELGTRHGQAATVRESDDYWAKGVPVVSLNDSRDVFGIICPVASRITPMIARRLARVVIVVASEQERERIQTRCLASQELLVITPP